MSDRAGIKPKGTMVRPAPDWFADRMYFGGFQVIGAAPTPGDSHWITVALFNNDQSGRVAKVYGVYTLTDGGGGMGLYVAQQPPGAKLGLVQSIRLDYPPVGVEVWQQVVETASDTVTPFTLGQQIGAVGCSGFDSDTVFSPFPIAIIPTGYSLVASNLIGSGSTGCGFWIQMANS